MLRVSDEGLNGPPGSLWPESVVEGIDEAIHHKKPS